MLKSTRIVTSMMAVLILMGCGVAVDAGDSEEAGLLKAAAGPAVSDSYQLADGSTRTFQSQDGFMWSDDPESPFSDLSGTCRVVIVTSPQGVVTFEMMMCDFVDSDGHGLYTMGIADAPAPVILDVVGGTGKFEGVSGKIDTMGAAHTSYPDGSGLFNMRVLEWSAPAEK